MIFHPIQVSMQTTGPIRVILIEDDRVVRDGLSALINGTPGYRCIATFRSVEEGLRCIDREVPDVLLLDIHLPGMSGSEGVCLLKERFPSMQVLMLTIYEDEERVFESLCNGACGYLLKNTPPAKLLDAIREAHEGGSPMSPAIARKVVRLIQETGLPENVEYRLMPQEVRLLELLSKGATYQVAANQLNISINTVRKYIRNIYVKLQVHSKSEAVRKALKSGLIS
jgi:DNA-binding NarL/FixJ family response regulator